MFDSLCQLVWRLPQGEGDVAPLHIDIAAATLRIKSRSVVLQGTWPSSALDKSQHHLTQFQHTQFTCRAHKLVEPAWQGALNKQSRLPCCAPKCGCQHLLIVLTVMLQLSIPFRCVVCSYCIILVFVFASLGIVSEWLSDNLRDGPILHLLHTAFTTQDAATHH